MKTHKLEGILASSAPLAEAMFYKNSAPNTPAQRTMGTAEPLINNSDITPYVGNFPESFAIPAISGFVGDYIEYQGQKRENKILQKIGQYFPEISATAISAYFTLGETILPQILPGTADIKDIPSALVSAFAGYTIAKVGRKSGFNKKIYALSEKATQ
ncbi:MAG: hypothetical protein ABEI74_02400 [Candidatus Pacearchaeota archaeon]